MVIISYRLRITYPENPLIFSIGPITYNNVPLNGRYAITTESLFTGILGDAKSGGFWGSELKYAGYALIVMS